MAEALRATSLTKSFGSFTAVDNISLMVEEGKIYGFLGANGAGKSTTIKMFCGIFPPTSGEATILGYDVAKYPDKVKENIGYMSQKFSLYNDLKVRENIEFYGGIHRLSSAQLNSRMEEIIAMANLAGKADVYTGTLSGGMKQRLALGCSIIHQPRVLFLDEPTAAVDPAARRHFWDLIHTMSASGITIFVTSHYMDEVEECHQVALMHNGRIAAAGNVQELKQKEIPGDILHAEGSPADVLKSALNKLPSVLRVDAYGLGFHAILRKGHLGNLNELARQIRKSAQGKIEGLRLKKIHPSMEDVFIWVIGQNEN